MVIMNRDGNGGEQRLPGQVVQYIIEPVQSELCSPIMFPPSIEITLFNNGTKSLRSGVVSFL